MKHGTYNQWDYEAIRLLRDFLPERVFDAHCHLFGPEVLEKVPTQEGTQERPGEDSTAYLREMGEIFGPERQVAMNFFLDPGLNGGVFSREGEGRFLLRELEQNPGSICERIVFPDDTVEDLERILIHPRIRGLKCYHLLLRHGKHPVEDTFQAEIGQFLPESAWQVAQERKLCITLHMVRDKALADPANFSYIRTMARRYPDATLILAHGARSFAAWTALEAAEELVDLENVLFDFSAVCESPALAWLLRKVGPSRCMWGSDYPISMARGKAISLGDSFYWIYEEDLARFAGPTPLHSWLVGIENLMAVRQACQLEELSRREVEALFCTTAEERLMV